MKYAVSAFSITVAVILILSAIIPLFFKPAPETAKKKDPLGRSARIKRLMKSNFAFPSRGPASVKSLAFEQPTSALAAIRSGGGANKLRSLSELIDQLEAAWDEVEAQPGPKDTVSVDHDSLIGLCKQNLAFACDRYYHYQRSRYFEAREKARTLGAGPARDEFMARVKTLRVRLNQFAKFNCLGGNSFGCQDVVDQPSGGDLLNVLKSYCLGGGIDYCMTVGFVLLNRWTRGQKQAKPREESLPHQHVVLDEAKTFMAKGCQAGSLEACSELIQGPLAELSDPRTALALEYFDNLCNEGDPAACVTVSGALYSGDREEIAEAVREYCSLRARSLERKMNDEERVVCVRLAQQTAVDDTLWGQMIGLMYEGPRLSAKVLDHLAPGRNVAAP